jgi:hypothetical protein
VLQKIAETGDRQPWNTGELRRLAGERMDPRLHTRAEEVDGELAAVLRFRLDMITELANPPANQEDT